jgi:hypothetical protein
MSPKILLATIVIGDKYINEYNILFRKSHELYAKKHGYDFKIVTNFLETSLSKSHRSTISFQKILIGCQDWSTEYDYIIIIDADILINTNAPQISIDTLKYKIGIVNEYSQPTKYERLAIQIRMDWERTPTDYYKLGDPSFNIETDLLLNTGFIIVQPAIHNAFLREIYNKYISMSINHSRGFHFEQAAIGYELQKNNMFTVMDNKWNAIWSLNKLSKKYSISLQQFYNSNYCIHFAGHVDYNLIPSLKL